MRSRFAQSSWTPFALGILLTVVCTGASQAHAANRQPISDQAPDKKQDVNKRERQAVERYSKGDFLNAAGIFEELWETTRAPRYLYNAGLAREGLGHDSHALLHWSRYRRLKAHSDAERANIDKQIERARGRTQLVTIRVSPANALHAGNATLRLRYVSESTAAVPDREPLYIAPDEIDPDTGEFSLGLDHGSWSISVDRLPEFEPFLVVVDSKPDPEGMVIDVKLVPRLGKIRLRSKHAWLPTPGGTNFTLTDERGVFPQQERTSGIRPVEVELPDGTWTATANRAGFSSDSREIAIVPGRIPEYELRPKLDLKSPLTRARLGLGAGLGGGGLVLFISGLGLRAKFFYFFPRGKSPNVPDEGNDGKDSDYEPHCGGGGDFVGTPKCPYYWEDHWRTGGTFLGMGLGLSTAGVIGGLVPWSRPAWITAGTTGAIFVLGGTLKYAKLATIPLPTSNEGGAEPWTEWGSKEKKKLTALGFVGFGIGLLAGSAAGILVEELTLRRRVTMPTISASLSRTQFSLAVSGRF